MGKLLEIVLGFIVTIGILFLLFLLIGAVLTIFGYYYGIEPVQQLPFPFS